MPVEQIIRAVAIDDLAICIQAWRYICDDCGRRDTFPDIPMPEGRSEMEPQRKGWVIRWDYGSDGELCRCPQCATKKSRAVAAKLADSTLKSRPICTPLLISGECTELPPTDTGSVT
jgi:hypothetical protein